MDLPESSYAIKIRKNMSRVIDVTLYYVQLRFTTQMNSIGISKNVERQIENNVVTEEDDPTVQL
jgi:hypothetical protein